MNNQITLTHLIFHGLLQSSGTRIAGAFAAQATGFSAMDQKS